MIILLYHGCLLTKFYPRHRVHTEMCRDAVFTIVVKPAMYYDT